VIADDVVQRDELVDAHDSLVLKSLIQIADGPSERRYRLLETIRAYAAQRLLADSSNDAEAIRRRHVDVFAAFAACEEEDDRYRHERLTRLTAELDDLWFALDSSIELRMIEAGLSLANALCEATYRPALIAKMDALLDRAPHPWGAVHVDAMINHSWLSFFADQSRRPARLDQALETAIALDDRARISDCYGALAADCQRVGDLDGELSMAELGVSAAEAAGDRSAERRSRRSRGTAHLHLGEWRKAQEDFTAAARLGVEADHLDSANQNRADLAWALVAAENYDEADAVVDLMLESPPASYSIHARVTALLAIAEISLHRGDPQAALAALRELAALALDTEDRASLASALMGGARALSAIGPDRAGAAAELLGAGDAVAHEVGRTLLLPDSDLRDRHATRLEETLGAQEFGVHYRKGRALSPADRLRLLLG
jgi:tetratricopeptide (TPR) repeat protein